MYFSIKQVAWSHRHRLGGDCRSLNLPAQPDTTTDYPFTAELVEGHVTTSQLEIREEELTWDPSGAACPAWHTGPA